MEKYFGIPLSWCCRTDPIDFGNDPSKVKELILADCKVERTVEKTIEKKGFFEFLGFLEKSKETSKIENFVNSEKLNLSWNELKRIPKEIFEKLTKLKVIHLSGVKSIDLAELAKNLNKTKIQKVDLSSAQFGNQESLGEFIRQTKKVEEIRFVL